MTLTAGRRAALLRRGKAPLPPSTGPSSSSSPTRSTHDSPHLGATSTSTSALATLVEASAGAPAGPGGATPYSPSRGSDTPFNRPAGSSSPTSSVSSAMRRLDRSAAAHQGSEGTTSIEPFMCSDGFRAYTFEYAEKREKRLSKKKREREAERNRRQEEERERRLREMEEERLEQERWRECATHEDGCCPVGLEELHGARVSKEQGLLPRGVPLAAPAPEAQGAPSLEHDKSGAEQTSIVYAGPQDGGLGSYIFANLGQASQRQMFSWSSPEERARVEARLKREEEARAEVRAAAAKVGATEFLGGFTSVVLNNRLFSTWRAGTSQSDGTGKEGQASEQKTGSQTKDATDATSSPTATTSAKKKKKNKNKKKKRGKGVTLQGEGEEGEDDEIEVRDDDAPSSPRPSSPSKEAASSATLPAEADPSSPQSATSLSSPSASASTSPQRGPTTDELLNETLRSPVLAPLSRLQIPGSPPRHPTTRLSTGPRDAGKANEKLDFAATFAEVDASEMPKASTNSSPCEPMRQAGEPTETWRVSSAGTESSSYHTAAGISSAEEATEAGSLGLVTNASSPEMAQQAFDSCSASLGTGEPSSDVQPTLSASHDQASGAPSVRSVLIEPGSVTTSTTWAGFTTSDSRDTAASNHTTTSITSAQSEGAVLPSHSAPSLREERSTPSPQRRLSNESSLGQKITPPAQQQHQQQSSTDAGLREGKEKEPATSSSPILSAVHTSPTRQGQEEGAKGPLLKTNRPSTPLLASTRSPRATPSPSSRRIVSAPLSPNHGAVSSSSPQQGGNGQGQDTQRSQTHQRPLPPTDLGLSQAVCSSSSSSGGTGDESAMSQGQAEARGRKLVGRQEMLERTRLWTSKGPYEAPSEWPEGRSGEVESSIKESTISPRANDEQSDQGQIGRQGIKLRRAAPHLRIQVGEKEHDVFGCDELRENTPWLASAEHQTLQSPHESHALQSPHEPHALHSPHEPHAFHSPCEARARHDVRSRSASGGSGGAEAVATTSSGVFPSSEPNSISFVLSPRSVGTPLPSSENSPFAFHVHRHATTEAEIEGLKTLDQFSSPVRKPWRSNAFRSSSLGASRLSPSESAARQMTPSPGTTRSHSQSLGDSSSPALTGSPSAPLNKSSMRAMLKRMPSFDAVHPRRSMERQERLRSSAWIGLEDRMAMRTRWMRDVALLRSRLEAEQVPRRDVFSGARDGSQYRADSGAAHTQGPGNLEIQSPSGQTLDAPTLHETSVEETPGARHPPLDVTRPRRSHTLLPEHVVAEEGQESANRSNPAQFEHPRSTPARRPDSPSFLHIKNVGEALAAARAAGLVGDESFMTTSTMDPEDMRREFVLLRPEIKQWTDRPWMHSLRSIDEEEKHAIDRFLTLGIEMGDSWWNEGGVACMTRPEYTTAREFERLRAAEAVRDAAPRPWQPPSWDCPRVSNDFWLQPEPHPSSDGIPYQSAAAGAMLVSGNVELEQLAQHRIEAFRSRSNERGDDPHWRRTQAQHQTQRQAQPMLRSHSESPSWERRRLRNVEPPATLSSSYHEGTSRPPQGLGLESIDEFAITAQDVFAGSRSGSEGELATTTAGPWDHDETVKEDRIGALRRTHAVGELAGLPGHSAGHGSFGGSHSPLAPLSGPRDGEGTRVASGSSNASSSIAEAQPRWQESQLPELDHLIHVHHHNLNTQHLHHRGSSQSDRRGSARESEPAQSDTGSEARSGYWQQRFPRPPPPSPAHRPRPHSRNQGTPHEEVDERGHRQRQQHPRRFWDGDAPRPPRFSSSAVSSPTDSRPRMEHGNYAETGATSGIATPWTPHSPQQPTHHLPMYAYGPPPPTPTLPIAYLPASLMAEYDMMRMDPQRWQSVHPGPATFPESALPAGLSFLEWHTQGQMLQRAILAQAQYQHHLYGQTHFPHFHRRFERFTVPTAPVEPGIDVSSSVVGTQSPPAQPELGTTIEADAQGTAEESAMEPSSSAPTAPRTSSPHSALVSDDPVRRTIRPPLGPPPTSWDAASLPPIPHTATLSPQGAIPAEDPNSPQSSPRRQRRFYEQRKGTAYDWESENGGERQAYSGGAGGSNSSTWFSRNAWRSTGDPNAKYHSQPSSGEGSYQSDRKPFSSRAGARSSDSSSGDWAAGNRHSPPARRTFSGACATAAAPAASAPPPSSDDAVAPGPLSSPREESRCGDETILAATDDAPASSPSPTFSASYPAMSPTTETCRLPAADSAWSVPFTARPPPPRDVGKQRERSSSGARASEASSGSSRNVGHRTSERASSTLAQKEVDRGDEMVPGAGRTRRKPGSQEAASSGGVSRR